MTVTSRRRSDPWFLIGVAAAIAATLIGGGLGIYLRVHYHLGDNIDRPTTGCVVRGR